MARKSKRELIAELDRRIDIDALLTDEEKLETRARAREHVRDERRKKAIDELFKREVKHAEREYEPQDQIVDIMIDLPPFAAMVRLDNTIYFHGLIYEVPMRVAQTIRDQMARSWEHQNEIDGKSRMADNTRRHQTMQLSPSNPGGTRLNTLDDFRRI